MPENQEEEKLENINIKSWRKTQKSTKNRTPSSSTTGANSTQTQSPMKSRKTGQSKKINLKLASEPEKDAVMVAIMKYINLFKNPIYDKIRNPVYPIKQNLIKIALREKWMSKCQQCGKVQEHDVFMDFAIKLKSKFGNEFNNDYLNSGKCPKCFKETPEYKAKLAN